jgi:hypothetical protein
VTHEDEMRSILLPTSLLFMLQTVVLQMVAPDPAAAASRKVDKANRNVADRSTRKAGLRAKLPGGGIASFYWQPQKVSAGRTPLWQRSEWVRVSLDASRAAS